MTRVIIMAMIATGCLTFSACGGGGGGGTTDNSTTTATGGTTPGDSPPVTAPLIAGFNFALQEGDYWEYRWDKYSYSYAQGSTSTTSLLTGRFRATLGAPITFQNTSAYPLLITGITGPPADPTKTYAPRWQYLAIKDNQILGSLDGVTFTAIFDAQSGFWPGGGFFNDLGSTVLNQATEGTITTPFNTSAYISGTAFKTGLSGSQSTCQYYPGVGNICGDSSYSYDSWEYFKPGIGPYGYYYYNTYSDCGGGFCSGATWEDMVGLVSSSLQGDTVNYILENEPNDNPSAPQTLANNQTVLGLAYPFADGWDVSGLGILLGPDIYGWSVIEDLYKFVLPLSSQPQTVKISLDFSGAAEPTTDYDIYLIDANGTYTIASGTTDNPSTTIYTEEINTLLFSGSYLIGVEAFNNTGKAEYKLTVSW